MSVKLQDESGAAGLIFASDGADTHYGFYPTAGQLRLTRFEGPSVFSWTILKTVPSEHYHPGDWNSLKVRVEDDKLLCFVNDRLVIESSDTGLREGKVGLAKFRETRASFKNFEVGKQIGLAAKTDAADLTELSKAVQQYRASEASDTPSDFFAAPEQSRELLNKEAVNHKVLTASCCNTSPMACTLGRSWAKSTQRPPCSSAPHTSKVAASKEMGAMCKSVQPASNCT